MECMSSQWSRFCGQLWEVITLEANLGGYDNSSRRESLAVGIVNKLFNQDSRLKPHFTENDKTPNFDGHFDICEPGERKDTPIGRFDAQIKSISNYLNNNKKPQSQYKYVCDTKIFNAVKNGITQNPAILFLVDVDTENIFWFYITVHD